MFPFMIDMTTSTEHASLPNSQQQGHLYIHPSDNSGVAPSVITLTGDNYRRWKISMLKALSVKNKLWLVDGYYERTTENAMQWDKCNDVVSARILNTGSKEIYTTIEEYEVAAKMWKDLDESFGQRNTSLIFQLNQETEECRQGNQSLTEYFTKLKGLWQQLYVLITPITCKCNKCECNLAKQAEAASQEDKLLKFLMGLNSVYDNARRQLLLTTPLPSPSAAHSLLLQEELGKKAMANQHTPMHTPMTALNVTYDSNRKGDSLMTKTGKICALTVVGNIKWRNVGIL